MLLYCFWALLFNQICNSIYFLHGYIIYTHSLMFHIMSLIYAEISIYIYCDVVFEEIHLSAPQSTEIHLRSLSHSTHSIHTDTHNDTHKHVSIFLSIYLSIYLYKYIVFLCVPFFFNLPVSQVELFSKR